ncbi:MAG: helix-turn-helix domain-containing protein [Chitinophagales bacterium]|nr:helix-turn-helix domain-containing protein [Chitinophagales bacterium]
MARSGIPVYSICNLLGTDRCLTDLLVLNLRSFLAESPDLIFPHRHSFYQILFITKGKGKHRIDFETHTVKPMQVHFLAPGQIHNWKFSPDADGYIINFDGSFITSVCHNPHFLNEFPFFNSITNRSVLELKKDAQPQVTNLMNSMMSEFRGEQDYRNDSLRALLLQLLITLARHCKPDTKTPAARYNYVLIRNFENLIEQNFRSKKLPKEYAALLFITPNHLNALCKSTVGKSAGEMIRDRVLLEAKRLLANSAMTIAEVAYYLQFEDNAYFSRFFKKYTGHTPEEFRKMQNT